MKRAQTMLAMILFLVVGCGGGKQSDIQSDSLIEVTQSDSLITVDVTASYPKKELILQDFMDVEYIPLETTDEFITQGFVLDIGKDIILVKNRANDGDIFFFDRSGKGIKKINRKGQGGEEYTYVLGITLDEEQGEMFVNDHFTRKVIVYDLNGNFKRSFKHKKGASYSRIYNFDPNSLICYDSFFTNNGERNEQSFLVVSKQDGSIVDEIQIPFAKKKSTVMMLKDEAKDMVYSIFPGTDYPVIPRRLDHPVLIEPSSDTIYSYSADHTLTPVIVRTPPVASMDPETFLFLSIITDRYYFMESVKKEYNWNTKKGFPATDLVYDKQEKTIFNYTVYNDDYTDQRTVYMNSDPVNDEVATWQGMDVSRLLEDYGKGKLKGRLKEIASKLDEESNPVIMLVKQKK